MKTKAFLALPLFFCILLPVLAQTKPAAPAQPQQEPDDKDDVVRITTNLVQVDAVVTKDGKAVPNLTADDFEIFEDGRKQTITSFAYISNVSKTTQPVAGAREKTTDGVPFTPLKRDDPRRTIAVVVDDLGLSADSMYQVRRQLRKFVAEELQPNDLVAILRTSGEMGALQQFTNDKRVLNRAVDQLRWNICSRVGISAFPALRHPAFGDHNDENNCGGTSYYQTIKALRFILDALGELPGRKSMVLLSDSLPAESQEAKLEEDSFEKLKITPRSYSALLQRIAEKAIRSSVVIYSVDTEGLQYTGLTAGDHTAASKGNLANLLNDTARFRSDLLWKRQQGGELIAKETGGFQIRNSNSFHLDRILEDQSGYYLLGYRPTDETFNKRFHHIKAKVKASGMTVRTRFGFYGVTEEEANQIRPPLRNTTNVALTSPFGAQDIEVGLTAFFINDRVIGSMVRSFVYFAGKNLTFVPVNDRQQASIELHGVIFGDNGSVIEQYKHGATISLSEEDYQRALKSGMSLTFDMPAKRPGSYQLRVAIKDRTSSQIGTAGQFVTVPDLNKNRLAVSGIVLGTVAGDATQAISNPGAKRFEANSNLYFACVVYNASQFASPVMEARLFRDGKNVYSGPEVPIQTANQPDPNRLLVSGSVKLSSNLEPGSYYLQVVITDKNGKDKVAPVVQWIDFEI
jgi:VWFA-related protein